MQKSSVKRLFLIIAAISVCHFSWIISKSHEEDLNQYEWTCDLRASNTVRYDSDAGALAISKQETNNQDALDGNDADMETGDRRQRALQFAEFGTLLQGRTQLESTATATATATAATTTANNNNNNNNLRRNAQENAYPFEGDNDQTQQSSSTMLPVRQCGCDAAINYFEWTRSSEDSDSQHEVDQNSPPQLDQNYCHVQHSHCGYTSIPTKRYDSDLKRWVRSADRSYQITCFTPTTTWQLILRITWLITVVSFAILLWGSLFTSTGRHAFHYILDTFCCCCKDHTSKLTTWIYQQNPYFANVMIERFLNRNPEERRAMEQIRAAEREARRSRRSIRVTRERRLVLKTKVYSSSTGTLAINSDDSNRKTLEHLETGSCSLSCSSASSTSSSPSPSLGSLQRDASDQELGDNENCSAAPASDDSIASHDYDSQCTICFCPLEEGVRVGAFPCTHTFHVECLKAWLARRNCCPLCLHQDVAKAETVETREVIEPAANSISTHRSDGDSDERGDRIQNDTDDAINADEAVDADDDDDENDDGAREDDDEPSDEEVPSQNEEHPTATDQPSR